MSFFSFGKTGKVTVVFDLSSGSIGGMIVSEKNGDKPQIIATARTPMNFLMDVDFEAFWRCTKDAVKKTMEKLSNDTHIRPDSCVLVFSSPWFVSQTKVLSVQREFSFKLTQDFVDKLVSDEESSFIERNAGYMTEGKMELLDHEIMKVEINGYDIEQPIGKMGKKVKLHIYMSLVSGRVKREMADEILRHFGSIPVRFTSFPLIAFKALGNMGMDDAKEGVVLVDIGGEITDISVVRERCLEETISFPMGKNFLLRKIAGKLNTFPKEAASALQIFLSEHGDEKKTKKVASIISAVEKEWCESFGRAIEALAERSLLPPTLYFMGGGQAGSIFIKCAQRENLARFSSMGKPFDVKKISTDSLSDYFNIIKNKSQENGKTEEEKDVFLMFESIFASKLQK